MRCASRVTLLIFLVTATAACHAQKMLRVSRIIMADQIDLSPAPDYPADAKGAGIEGTVALDVIVSSTGKMEQVQVLTGPDKLREAAKSAVTTWTYKPYLIDGVAREFETTVLVEFSLKNGGITRNASGDVVETVTDARVATPAEPSASDPKVNGPVRVSGGVSAGFILHKEAPVYPYQAKIDHVSGTVVLHAIISKSGTIDSVKVLSGDDRLQQAAVDAVSKWTYKPYLLLGKPVEVDTQITVNFNFGAPVRTTPDSRNGSPGAPPIGSGGFGPH